MSDDESKQGGVAEIVQDTEMLALMQENERLNAELENLRKQAESLTPRKASAYVEGVEIPEGFGVFAVELWSKRKGNKQSECLYRKEIVAPDESDSIRQGLIELCDERGWNTPPDLIRKAKPTLQTEKQREDRLRFDKWRRSNAVREEAGQPMLPLPKGLEQFKDRLTDVERMASQ